MKQFVRDLTNIKESKVSALMIFFIPTMTVALVIAVLRGDVPPNLAYIIMTMIGGITGVNLFVSKGNSTLGTGNMNNMYGGYGGYGYGGYYGGYNNYNYGNQNDTEDTPNTNDNNAGI